MTSVGQTVSSVKETPQKNAVTQAVSAKEKNADVDRKIRFYGVIQAFREGRYPDNRQIDETLSFVEKNSPVNLEELSEDGRKLVQDFRAIIHTARQMVQDKNASEEIQNFLYASRKAAVADNAGVKSSLSKDDARKDAETAGEAFRTIIKLFLRNGEFRKLVNDAGVMGRDIFADAAVKASDMARPDEEKLAQVDQPAPDNEFHDDIPQALKTKSPEEKEAAQKEKEAEKAAAKARAQQAANNIDPNDPTNQQSKNAVNAQAQEQKEVLLSKIPQEHKDRINEHKDKTANYFKEKFPEERRDHYIFRLKKVLVECQRHRDWQDAITYILNTLENYKGHANDIHTQVEGSAKNVRGEGNIQTAENAFRTLLERFANGRPTQPFMNAVDQIYTDVKNDPELKDWFKRLDSYIRRALLEPGYVMKDDADREARQLVESGKKFFVASEGRDQGKYKPHVDALWDELTTFTKGMSEDPLNVKFGEQWKTLFNDLIYDSRGSPKFKAALLQDIVQTILPQLLRHVSFVPLPRIEYTDSEVDLVVENIAVAPINLLPNLFEFEAKNYVKASAFKGIDNRHHHSFKLTLSQVHLEMRDVYFQINKKTGMKVQEHGVADVLLGGKGMTVTAHIEGGNEPRGRRARNVFVVKQVKAQIDNLDFAIRKSKHDLAIKIFRPLAKSIIKKQVAKAAEAGIRDALEKLNDQLTEARNAVYDAEEGKKGDALKQKFSKDKSETATAGEKKGTFKIPTSKRDSVLPNLGSKDGWIHKLDERNEAAKDATKGPQDWHSPAFSIVGRS
ncbi:hypothetical protein BDZ90DRAFT_238789 [Jaminaea rosea]|uniref:Uncharacterized protein n=1 Tax=Jaminaea rosea TaxID=1569628 RepID=A0A316UX61_9BASI|nr:hypothetical protein BDZ90DRAFT_238789 [Jaminaea rosea]PWN28503.1 hypothetical protein BDZ90DRAFT_238789 [Jaminaea rosea]